MILAPWRKEIRHTTAVMGLGQDKGTSRRVMATPRSLRRGPGKLGRELDRIPPPRLAQITGVWGKFSSNPKFFVKLPGELGMAPDCAACSLTVEFILCRRVGIKLPSAALEPDAPAAAGNPPVPPGGAAETRMWGKTGCPRVARTVLSTRKSGHLRFGEGEQG